MSLYEIENFGIPEGFDIHWQITFFVIVFCLFRIVYNTELDICAMSSKEKFLHYLILINQVIFAFLFAFLPYLNFNK